MPDLRVDPARFDYHGHTGIYIRAKSGDHWINADIAELDADSLKVWLRSREHMAVNVVLTLLGHPREAMSDG